MKTVFFSNGVIIADHSQARLRRAIRWEKRFDPSVKYCFREETARRRGYIG